MSQIKKIKKDFNLVKIEYTCTEDERGIGDA